MRLSSLILKSLLPLLLLNGTVMLFSLVWLVMLGIWQSAWPGVLFIMLSPVLCPALMFPGSLFAGLIHAFPGRPVPTAAMMIGAAICFTGILSGSAAFLFMLAESYLRGDNMQAAAQWVAGAAMMPWLLLAMKDRENVFFISMLFILQIAVLAGLGALVFGGWKIGCVFWAMWGGTAAAVCLMMAADHALQNKKSISS